MKQTKLVIDVFENVKDPSDLFLSSSDHVKTVDPASFENVKSCIDLWHSSGTVIVLKFTEVEELKPSDN